MRGRRNRNATQRAVAVSRLPLKRFVPLGALAVVVRRGISGGFGKERLRMSNLVRPGTGVYTTRLTRLHKCGMGPGAGARPPG